MKTSDAVGLTLFVVAVMGASALLTYRMGYSEGMSRGYEAAMADEKKGKEWVAEQMRGLGFCEWTTVQHSKMGCAEKLK